MSSTRPIQTKSIKRIVIWDRSSSGPTSGLRWTEVLEVRDNSSPTEGQEGRRVEVGVTGHDKPETYPINGPFVNKLHY